MPKFRKKPVVIEAVQWTGKNNNEIADFYPDVEGALGEPVLFVRTLEGVMQVNVGDYVIRGVAGEFYPCKPDIFAATYDAVA